MFFLTPGLISKEAFRNSMVLPLGLTQKVRMPLQKNKKCTTRKRCYYFMLKNAPLSSEMLTFGLAREWCIF